MKKIFLTIGFLSIFFSYSNIALAATCTWTASKGVIVPGTTGAVWNCPDSNTKESDNVSACNGSQPGLDYLCCCPNGTAPTPEKPTLFTMPDFQVKIPGMTKLADVSCNPGESCSIPWIGEYTKGIYNYLIAIVGVVAAIVLMAGGVLWLVSRGEASKITQAKDLIVGAITGLIILASSYLILLQINPNLVNLQNVSVNNIKKIEVYPDADITVVGGARAYADGCAAAKKGDLSICKAYGETPPEGLVSVEKVKANASVAQRYKAAMECVKAKNGKYLFYINEAWRSPATQIKYKEDPTKTAATPCCSNHGAGQALDINRLDGQPMSWAFNESSGLKKCMNDNTLYATTVLKSDPSKEAWHWSPTGK